MNENPCHIGWTYRLIWVFIGHIGLIVGFRWLNANIVYQFLLKYEKKQYLVAFFIVFIYFIYLFIYWLFFRCLVLNSYSKKYEKNKGLKQH